MELKTLSCWALDYQTGIGSQEFGFFGRKEPKSQGLRWERKPKIIDAKPWQTASLRKQKVADNTLQLDAEPSCYLAIVTGSIGFSGSVVFSVTSQDSNVELMLWDLIVDWGLED